MKEKFAKKKVLTRREKKKRKKKPRLKRLSVLDREIRYIFDTFGTVLDVWDFLRLLGTF